MEKIIKNLRRSLGIIILVLAVCFWVYVGFWLNFVYPIVELIKLGFAGMELNLWIEALKILGRFFISLIITSLLYFLGLVLLTD